MTRRKMKIDDITQLIIGEALGIHRALGPGLLESVYEAILAKALARKGLSVKRQSRVKIEYDGIVFDDAFRCDLLVNELVIVELKSVENLAPVHSKQVLTYLRLMNLEVGLLINFGASILKNGLKRIVNKHNPGEDTKLEINRANSSNPLS